MADEMVERVALDYQAILERYIRAVLEDDHIVGLRCCSAESFIGSDEERAELQRIAAAQWEEMVPGEPVEFNEKKAENDG